MRRRAWRCKKGASLEHDSDADPIRFGESSAGKPLADRTGDPSRAGGAITPYTRRQILSILAGLMLGMVLAALDQTIVSTALPTIAGELGGINHLPWIVTAYLLTSTISTPLWGKLGDLHGRRGLFQAAIVIFLAGSVVSGISQNMGQLIAFRALQGVGAGGLIVGAMAIVGDILSPRERGRYQGLFGAVFGFSSVAGPLLGGFFTDHLTWRWVFYINVPIGILALYVTSVVLLLPKKRREHVIDYLGTLLLGCGVTAIILVTTWGGNEHPWSSPLILGLALVGLALLVGFVFVERRAPEPLIPMQLFRVHTFSLTSLLGFIVGVAMFGAIVYLPLYLQLVHGVSATASGLLMLPLMVGLLSVSTIAGILITRSGRYRVFPIAGAGLMVLGMFLLSLLTVDTPLRVASIYMLIVGMGLGGVMQVLVIAVQNAVPYEHLGTATASATFFRSIGGSFGVALFGGIFNQAFIRNAPRTIPAHALGLFAGGDIAQSPAALAKLPPEVHRGFVEAVAQSLHIVFLVAGFVALLAFGLAWLLREVPLRHTTFEPEGVAAPHPGSS